MSQVNYFDILELRYFGFSIHNTKFLKLTQDIIELVSNKLHNMIYDNHNFLETTKPNS